MSVRVAALLVLVAGALWRPAVAAARQADRTAEARAHFDRGAAHAEQRDYEDASREFEAAFNLDPRKEFLFAWAQVERLRGNCLRAIELYRKFLASDGLTSAQTEAANRHLAGCEKVVAEARQVAAAPPPAPPPPLQVARPAAPRAPEPAPRGARILAASLLAGAVAAAAGAATFFVLSRGDEQDAQQPDITYDDYEAAVLRARGRQRVAAVLGAGAGLLGGAALLIWLGPGTPERRLGAWVDGTGAGLAMGGRY